MLVSIKINRLLRCALLPVLSLAVMPVIRRRSSSGSRPSSRRGALRPRPRALYTPLTHPCAQLGCDHRRSRQCTLTRDMLTIVRTTFKHSGARCLPPAREMHAADGARAQFEPSFGINRILYLLLEHSV
jgi:hypothetical protein